MEPKYRSEVEGDMIDYKNKRRNCTKCGKIKYFIDFYWNSIRNIPRSVCKECELKEKAKKYDSMKAREKYNIKKGKTK